MSNDELIIDDYILENCIATGSTTQIWEVIEKGSRKPFAMKLMLPEAFKNPQEKRIFKMEAGYYERLVHPNLINFYKLEIGKTRAYFIMQYFRAANLKTQITNNPVEAQARTKKILEALSQVLGYIHEEGLVHRDVKPDNILVSGGSEIKLIDFSLTTKYSKGVGKLLGGKLKFIQGTRTYIAPETILKKKPTPQTDMYSLGITLYELLTGAPPFKGITPEDLLKKHLTAKVSAPSEFDPNITPEMDEIVLKLLEKKPENRPESMAEVASSVRNLEPFVEDPRELYRVKMERDKEENLKSLAEATKLDSRADAERTLKGIKSDFDPKKARQPLPAVIKRSTDSSTSSQPEPVSEDVPKVSVPQQPSAPPPQTQMPQQPMMPGYPQGQFPPGYPTGQYPMSPPGYPPAQYPTPQPGYPQQGYPGQPYGQPVPGQPYPAGYPQQPGYPRQIPGQPGIAPTPNPPGQQYPVQPGMSPGSPAGATPTNQTPVQQPVPPAANQPPGQQPPAPTQQGVAPKGTPPIPPPPAQPAPPANQPQKPKEDLPLMDDLPDVS